MSIKKSGRIANGVTKSAKNLTPEAGDTIKSIVDVLVDILVVITNKKNNGTKDIYYGNVN